MQAVVTSPHLEAALAVYFEKDGKWEPGLYGREVTWKTTSNVPAGKMASMFEPACGKVNENFWNRGGNVRIGVGGFPCEKSQGPIWLNIYVRGDLEQPYRFLF